MYAKPYKMKPSDWDSSLVYTGLAELISEVLIILLLNLGKIISKTSFINLKWNNRERKSKTESKHQSIFLSGKNKILLHAIPSPLCVHICMDW